MLPYNLDDTRGFSEGLAAFKRNDLWGYINDAGEVVVEPEFAEANDFSDGLALVLRTEYYCLINTKGEIVVPCAMDEVVQMDKDLLRLEKQNKMAYFDLRTKTMMWQAKGF